MIKKIIKAIFPELVEIKLEEHKRECHKCLGYGVFDDNLELVKCPECNSVHANYFDSYHYTFADHRHIYLD